MSLIQKYYDLKTIQKISLLIGFMTIFMIAIGAVAFLFLNEANDEFNELYEQNLKKIDLYNELNTQAEKSKTNLVLLITGHTLEDKKEHFNDLKQIKKDSEQKTKELNSKKLNEYEKEKFAEYNELNKKTESIRNNIINYGMNFEEEKAIKLFEEKLREELNVGTTILEELIKYNLKEAEKADISAKQHSQKAFAIMALTIIVALILSILFGSFIALRIQGLLDKLVSKMNTIANGDLSVEKFGNVSKSDVGQLCASFDTLLDSLTNIIYQISLAVKSISMSSEEMDNCADRTTQGSQQTAVASEQLAQGVQEVSTNIEEGATTIGNMNNMIQSVSQEAVDVAKLGNETEVNANEGSEYVQKAVGKINNIKIVAGDISETVSKLGELSAQIETIVDLIKNIAGQTNLLALNAAIEAARAGEHGKGFAVVADEVKKLAGQSADATDKITGMIKEIQNETALAVNKMDKATREVEEGVNVVNDTGKTLENIIEQVKLANNKIQGITGKIEEVAQNSDNVVKMIENVSAVTEETAASAEEISSISLEGSSSIDEINTHAHSLNKLAGNLRNLTGKFKLPSGFNSDDKSYFLDLRLMDHHNWVNKLKKAIDTKNTKVQLQFNHSLCNFGKWYFNYTPSAKERAVFEKINKPHQLIHETGHKIYEEIKKGNNKKAEEIFNNETLRLMKEIEGLFEELKRCS